uniref:Histone-lysine N-methyltransferase n=1 Tax=Panagrolaimus sp. PS1159 TaxID=55785 RepID=A0AC35FY65_9BILA
MTTEVINDEGRGPGGEPASTETEEEILQEAEIDLTGVPCSEITAEDVAGAIKKENELRERRLEARYNGARIVPTVRLIVFLYAYKYLVFLWEHWLKLARSTIHGRCVFAIKSILKNTCLIEYVGTFIHQTEADRKEKQYREAGITSIYFFAVSNGVVIDIDATKFGNNARYINHACRANVYSKEYDVDGQKKIFFHAKRNIQAGEELTIDYNFEYDPLQQRIPCKCGLPGCRKYLDL